MAAGKDSGTPWLVKAVCRITDFWHLRVSFFGHSSLSKPGHGLAVHANRRDVVYIVLVAMSCASIVVTGVVGTKVVGAMIVAMAAFRIIGSVVTVLRHGVIGTLRDDRPVTSLSPQHMQRLVLASLLNYIEVMFWFTAMYLSFAKHGEAFAGDVDTWQGALLLSWSTQTTVGFGTVAPQGGVGVVLACVQAGFGILLPVLLIGPVVALALAPKSPPELPSPPAQTGSEGGAGSDPPKEPGRGISPILGSLLFLAGAFVVAYLML